MKRNKYIDQIDLHLLNFIKAYPSATIAEIGETVDLTPGPTHTRLHKLKEKGFYRPDTKVYYSRFGLEEKVCIFELKQSEESSTTFNPKRNFDNIVKKLSEARMSLIESIELFSDNNQKNWIMIRLHPVKNIAIKRDEAGRKTSYDYQSEIFTLLIYHLAHSRERIYHLEQKVEVLPILSAEHRMKNEPPLLGGFFLLIECIGYLWLK